MITFPPFPEHFGVIGLINSPSVQWFAWNILSPSICVTMMVLNGSARGKSGLEPQALSYGRKSLWAGSTPGPGRAGDSSDASGGEMEFFFLPLLGPRVVCVFFRIQRISILCLYLGLFDGPHFHTLSLLEVGCICLFFY